MITDEIAITMASVANHYTCSQCKNRFPASWIGEGRYGAERVGNQCFCSAVCKKNYFKKGKRLEVKFSPRPEMEALVRIHRTAEKA